HREQVPSRIERADRGGELLHPEVAYPSFGWLLSAAEPRVEQRDVERRILGGERRNEVPHVRADPAGRREVELIDLDRGARHRDASMHSTPSGPTVAECSVPGGRSSRSPAESSTSPSRRWNVNDPSRQNSTLW